MSTYRWRVDIDCSRTRSPSIFVSASSDEHEPRANVFVEDSREDVARSGASSPIMFVSANEDEHEPRATVFISGCRDVRRGERVEREPRAKVFVNGCRENVARSATRSPNMFCDRACSATEFYGTRTLILVLGFERAPLGCDTFGVR